MIRFNFLIPIGFFIPLLLVLFVAYTWGVDALLILVGAALILFLF